MSDFVPDGSDDYLKPASMAAQSGGGYDLTWDVIASGGTTFSAGGSYALGGTIGQADPETLSGGAFCAGYFSHPCLFLREGGGHAARP